MSSALVLSTEELEAQRAKLLQEIDMDYAELKRRADSYALRSDERSIWETISGIDFLLGDGSDF